MLAKNTDIGVFILATTGLILLLIGFIILILFLYKRKQLNYYNHLESLKNDYEKSLLSATLEIQEETFKHISREIHDNISLSLSVAKMALLTINWDNATSIHEKVDVTLEQLAKAIDDIRFLSHTLNTEYIAENGLLKAIDREMEQIGRLELHKTRVDLSGNYVSMEAKTEVMVFRIVQEALHNSIKHAAASSLFISMDYTEKYLHIKVCDNGLEWKGYPVNGEEMPAGGSGLNNMRERAQLLNGKCTIEHLPGEGTTVNITVPY
jgi:two-component system, NarL family, sensor kinase